MLVRPRAKAATALAQISAIIAAALTSLLAAASTAHADVDREIAARYVRGDAAQVTISDINALVGDTDAEISGASSLTWSRDGVGFDYNTADLEPDAPYTMWWVTFNRPRKCLSACECGLVDLADPAVDAGVFFAGGRMTDQHGQADFAGEIDYGELPTGEDQIPFPGIEAAIKRRSEIHLVVREHGEALADPADLKAQLTQFNGGCGPNSCNDVQVSIHRSQFCRKRSRR